MSRRGALFNSIPASHRVTDSYFLPNTSCEIINITKSNKPNKRGQFLLQLDDVRTLLLLLTTNYNESSPIRLLYICLFPSHRIQMSRPLVKRYKRSPEVALFFFSLNQSISLNSMLIFESCIKMLLVISASEKDFAQNG